MDNRLYVGNLPDDVSSDALKQRFSEHGEVAEVHLPVDRGSGRLRGYAFVTMSTADGARKAIDKLDGAMFEDRPLRVREAGEEREGSQSARATARRKDEVRITMQFRERHNMTYELDCAGVLLHVRMFPMSRDEADGWRFEANIKQVVSVPPSDPPLVVSATAPTRALALQALAREWVERTTSADATSELKAVDWTAITDALTIVRAL